MVEQSAGAGQVQVLAGLVSYLILMLGIGVFSARFSSHGISEFFVGGRRMPRVVVALSAVVSGRSAWLLLGVTGLAYRLGVAAVWAVTGYIVAELLLFVYYARRLRLFAEAYDCLTIPDVFAARFQDETGALRRVLATVMVVFMMSYVAAQFIAGGKAFSASLGLDLTTGLWITAAIVLAYTVSGGFLAVSLTDVVQAILMLVALVIVPWLAVRDAGGVAGLFSQLHAADASLLDPFSIPALVLVGFLGIGLGSAGNPHILVRFMSIRDPDSLRAAALVGTAWNVLMAWGALLIGLAGRARFPSIDLLPNADTEQLYPHLAQIHLHPFLLGLVIASIFAAIMSTADSQLLVAASSLVRDVYEKVMRRDRPVEVGRLVLYSRIVVLVLVAVAALLGLLAHRLDLVFWLVLLGWAGLGAALGPASILALYWRRATKAGAVAGVLAGAITSGIWYLVPGLKAIVYELIPGFLVGALVTIVVSLRTAPPRNVKAMFEAMGAPQPR